MVEEKRSCTAQGRLRAALSSLAAPTALRSHSLDHDAQRCSPRPPPRGSAPQGQGDFGSQMITDQRCTAFRGQTWSYRTSGDKRHPFPEQPGTSEFPFGGKRRCAGCNAAQSYTRPQRHPGWRRYKCTTGLSLGGGGGVRNANMNERSRGCRLLHGQGTISTSKVGG